VCTVYNILIYFNIPKQTNVTQILIHQHTHWVGKLKVPELINILMSIVICEFIDLPNVQFHDQKSL
jgi:hypothetical protein